MTGYIHGGDPEDKTERESSFDEALILAHRLETLVREVGSFGQIELPPHFCEDGKKVHIKNLILTRFGFNLRSYYVKIPRKMRGYDWNRVGADLLPYDGPRRHEERSTPMKGEQLDLFIRLLGIQTNQLIRIVNQLLMLDDAAEY